MNAPKIRVEIVRLTTDVAELLIHADFENDPHPVVSLRGRLMGPHCPGVSTIETAYIIKSVASTNPTIRSGRVVIPEPNLWTELRPFVYWGPAEFWDNEQLIHTQRIEVGLRMADKSKPGQ